MSPPAEGPSRFKSHFSKRSLLPPRHTPPPDPFPPPQPLPPLQVSHSVPPTREVDAARQATLVAHDTFSPVQSEYPQTPGFISDDESSPAVPPLPPTKTSTQPLRPARPGDRPRHAAVQHQPTISDAGMGRTSEKEMDDVADEGDVIVMLQPHTSSPSSKPTASPPRRPPPLDLSKTLKHYPGISGVVASAGTLPRQPSPPPVPEKKQSKRGGGWFRSHNAEPNPPNAPPAIIEKQTVPRELDVSDVGKGRRNVSDGSDPFQLCEIEPGHRYPSWKHGRVSIKPGQVVPQGVLGTPTIRGQTLHRQPYIDDPQKPNGLMPPTPYENQDDVLHNVLLTATYLEHSPVASSSISNSREERKKALTGKMSDAIDRGSKWIGRSILKKDDGSDRVQRAVGEMRDRQIREMAKFRQANAPLPLGSIDSLPATVQGRSQTPSRRREELYEQRESPGYAELAAGWEAKHAKRHKYKDEKKQGRGCRFWKKVKKEKEDKKKKLYKYAIGFIIIILATLTIGLCTAFLTQRSSSSSSPSSPSAASSSNISFTSSTSPPQTSSTPTSKSLQTCLDQFTSSAPTSPSSYPCADCVPLLTSTTTDFDEPFDNGNSTGVGAALQFCALMDVLGSTVSTGLSSGGWGKDNSPCDDWTGVTCDPRGRITALKLQNPDIPGHLSSTLGNIVSLSSLEIIGNNTAPSGPFPTALLSLSNLTSLDLGYTALTGPMASFDFSKTSTLSTLQLVNNPVLGNAMPDLTKNAQLVTLAMTGSNLTTLSESSLPSSLTYLDLSYNDFTGQIPSFSTLNSLQTLYLTNNAFTAAPSSLPASLSTLQLTSNPNLSGSMPSALCSSKILNNCALQNTKLSSAPATSTSNSSTAGLPTSNISNRATNTANATCGVCQFS